MTIANMIITEVRPVNKQIAADRLLTNQMVVFNGLIGLLEDAKFDDVAENVTVTIRFFNTTGYFTQTTTVERKFMFQVLDIVPVA